ncbi:MAG: hypothetical protein ABW171_01150 [Steroidobacter sp.]
MKLSSAWRRIEPYLDRALDLEREQAEVWLDDLARTEPEMATIVRNLLTVRDALNAAGFLATPITESGLAWLTPGSLDLEDLFATLPATHALSPPPRIPRGPHSAGHRPATPCAPRPTPATRHDAFLLHAWYTD